MAEPPLPTIVAIAAAVAEAMSSFLDKPYAVLGHSMGAWVAHEVIHELTRRGASQPIKAYFSANRAAHLHGPEHDVDTETPMLHRLSQADFWVAFEKRYGRNPDLQDTFIRDFVYPLLQNDFAALETHVPSDLAALPCPISALGGQGDNRYTAAQISAWEQHSSKDFSVHWFDGKSGYWGTPHRFVTDHYEPVVEFLKTDLMKAFQVSQNS